MTYQLYNEDYLNGVSKIPDGSVDLVISDPPYGLGKDFGNKSDVMTHEEAVEWTLLWIDLTLPKLKPTATCYIVTTWRNSPEIFSAIKKRLIMVNEIIWDRCVPSMGGSTRRFSSVHDNIGMFAVSKDYYFDIDSVRIPYDEETKKARTRSQFEGAKWLEVGYNPKDVWKVSRLHRQHREREDHPTQKPMELIDRMVKASCPEGGTVLDPFAGSGTTVEVCEAINRECIAFEINSGYCELIENRLVRKCGLFHGNL